MKPKHIFTDKEIDIIRAAKLKHEDISMFLHCKNCIPSKVPPGMSPEMFGSYEIASSIIKVGEGSLSVVSVWCRNCLKLVWDSRHLTHLY